MAESWHPARNEEPRRSVWSVIKKPELQGFVTGMFLMGVFAGLYVWLELLPMERFEIASQLEGVQDEVYLRAIGRRGALREYDRSTKSQIGLDHCDKAYYVGSGAWAAIACVQDGVVVEVTRMGL